MLSLTLHHFNLHFLTITKRPFSNLTSGFENLVEFLYKILSSRTIIEFDFLRDDYSALLKWSNPDVIVHCAAITNLDYCEENKIKA